MTRQPPQPNPHVLQQTPMRHTITVDLNWPDTTPAALEHVPAEVAASCIALAAHMADTTLSGLGIPTAITITRTTHSDTGPPMQPLDQDAA